MVAEARRGSGVAGTEASVAFLHGERAQLATLASDLRALPSWRDRGVLIYEHLFPPRSYMRGVYAPASRAPLPVLYLRRVVRGAWRWLGRA